MTKPKDEDKEEGKDKEAKGGEEKSEKKDEAPPEKKEDKKDGGDKKDGPPAVKKAEHKFKDVLSKLEKFKVHLDADKIKSAEELVEQLETALHALEGAMDGDGADAAAGGAPGTPPEQTLEPEQGSMFMSLKTDNEALKKALLEKDSQVLSLERTATSMVFSAVERDTEELQRTGRCTKAQRDDWLARIKAISSAQRFSLLEPSRSVDMASVCAEIRVSRAVPEGTFLAKAQVPAPVIQTQDYQALLFSNASVGANNGHLVPQANKEAVEAVKMPDGVPVEPEKKAEFEDVWKNIRMSLGIKA